MVVELPPEPDEAAKSIDESQTDLDLPADSPSKQHPKADGKHDRQKSSTGSPGTASSGGDHPPSSGEGKKAKRKTPKTETVFGIVKPVYCAMVSVIQMVSSTVFPPLSPRRK